jgi:glycosyltransferase involved in cell wall biosynthesis
VLSLLSQLHARLGALPETHLSRRTLRRVGRIWLRTSILARESSRPDDVTVLIGVRNRADERLINAVRSLRAQRFDPQRLRVMVVDYGSSPEQLTGTREICQRHGAEHVAVDGASVWSRSRCMNVGLRRSQTKYLLASDADIVFSPGYVADACERMRAAPLAVVCSRMFDLPEDSVDTVSRAETCTEPPRTEEWKERSAPRYEWVHPSICMTYTSCFQLMRGYDEFYELWGGEDDDLMRRFVDLGLLPTALDSDSFYLHQWHPKFSGLLAGRDSEPVQRNEAYFRSHRSILRNHADWGLAAAIPRAERRYA